MIRITKKEVIEDERMIDVFTHELSFNMSHKYSYSPK